MKKLLLTATAAIPLYAAADIYRYTFLRRRSRLSEALFDKKTHGTDYYAWRDAAAEKLRGQVHLCYTIRSDRGETLQGFYFPCGAKFSGRIAFIVHGYHSEHAETAGMLREYYHSRGFDIFAPDNTASGMSGGGVFGYDVLESADCLKWLDFLKAEFGGDIQVVMHGFSLGGATVLKMSDRAPDTVKFTVSDSGFIDAREILKRRLGPLYGPMYELNKLIGGYDLADSDVSENVRCSRQPMLIVHGREDPTVPFSMAERIYELCPADKDFLFTDKARHIETMYLAPEVYAEKLDGFIKRYIK